VPGMPGNGGPMGGNGGNVITGGNVGCVFPRVGMGAAVVGSVFPGNIVPVGPFVTGVGTGVPGVDVVNCGGMVRPGGRVPKGRVNPGGNGSPGGS